jgi:hypothetical protein
MMASTVLQKRGSGGPIRLSKLSGCLLRVFVPKDSSLSIVVGRDENSTKPIGCEWPSIVNWNRAHSAVRPHSLNAL